MKKKRREEVEVPHAEWVCAYDLAHLYFTTEAGKSQEEVSEMFWVAITSILCAVIGSLINYLGIECVIYAFDLAGGEAIGVFFAGILLAILGLISSAMFAMLGKIFLDMLKGDDYE